MIFAQAQIDSAPPEFVKWFFVVLFALIVVAGVIVGIYATFRKSDPQKLNDDPPIEVRKSPKRFNFDLTEQRHHDHERRILELEARSNELIEKLETDKQEILDAGEKRGNELRAEINDTRRELDRKIEQMPDRLITTLKNTGAI